jgi:hypothetical protein
MRLLLTAVVLVFFVMLAARSFRLAAELFRISVNGGKVELTRGRLPRALFDEICDVVRREHVRNAVISAVKSAGRARLVVEASNSRAVEQPLRNVLGRFSIDQIRTGSMRAR